MKRIFIHASLFVLSCCAFTLSAQNVQLTPQVIASQGNSFQNSQFEVAYTVGELAAITTITNTAADLGLTQGFHQPDKFWIAIGIQEPVGLVSASLYPNPASDNLFLSIESVSSGSLIADLFDASGRKIMASHKLNQIPGSQQFEMSISGLAAGTYLIRLSSADGNSQKTFKFTKAYH